MVRLMLVFAPAAFIVAGIGLSGAFDVFKSAKFQLVILVFHFLACALCWSHVVLTTHRLMVLRHVLVERFTHILSITMPENSKLFVLIIALN
ncbi:hypothetical protein MKW92_018823 [Papaver armeniacum]|nr:hypothetical protein MKW92_018823 [Papaver armeniacum]